MWDENTLYRKELARYFVQPVRFPKNSTDFDNLTWFILKADYDDNLIDGKVVGTFSSTRGARVQSCYTVSTSYTAVSVSSCGSNCYEVNFTLYTSNQTFCFNDSGDYYQSVLPADLVAGGSGYNPIYEYVRTYNPKNGVG